jgi:DNA-binding transcriptional regulator YdaS (Cro superfamily)
MLAGMKLGDYLASKKIPVIEFAAQIGVTPEGLRYWLAGSRTPRPYWMSKIVAATGGAVMPNDFLQEPAIPQDANEGV